MSVKLVPEEDLRAALRPYRADVSGFEAGVRERIRAGAESHEDENSEEQSSLVRVAAAFLPWPVVAGGKIVGSGAKLSSPALGPKLLGYAALPAISLFLLAGTAFFSALKIRSIQRGNHPDVGDEKEMQEAVRQWWGRHRWVALAVFAAVVILPMIGSAWLLFLLLLVSFGPLLCLLSGFAKLGVGNRLVIGRSCLVGLVFLGQAMLYPSVGRSDIHFVDQALIAVVLYVGTLILLPLPISSARPHWAWALLYASMIVPMLAWFTNPIWRPATPARIQHHVESFEEGRFASIAWRDWEIAARWTIEAGLDPDLSRARRLLGDEISGEQNPFVLSSASRVGLVHPDHIGRLAGLESRRQSLIPGHRHRPGLPITSLNQKVWVVHALNESGQLSPDDRDVLQQRLLATFDQLDDATADVLETALRVTQLLDAIDRPIDRDAYRERVHGWLREFHSKSTHGHLIAGGFQQYKGLSSSLHATSHAVELMEIYGVPDDLDLNWVRSYLRPLYHRPSNDKWIAAVTLDRLNRLPGVTGPTWLDILYCERSLIAAMVLVAFCVYATWSSPVVAASSNHDDAGNDAS